MICSTCRRSWVNLFRFCFLAEGMLVILLGVVLLFVDQFVTVSTSDPADGSRIEIPWTSLNGDRQYVFDPPDWLAYAAISLGAVTVLYTIALPSRSQHHHEHGHH